VAVAVAAEEMVLTQQQAVVGVEAVLHTLLFLFLLGFYLTYFTFLLEGEELAELLSPPEARV
jgi:hypothetical protein